MTVDPGGFTRPEPTRLDRLYRTIRDRFRVAGLETADLDARLLVCHALRIDPLRLISDPDLNVPPEAGFRVERMAERRLRREPVGRIVGEREFWGRPFFLSPHTLEPRADTETLVEAVASKLRTRSGTSAGSEAVRILDLGTGTGAVLVSLLLECPGARGIATDISLEALQTARRNAHRHAVGDRARFVCADYLAAFRGAFDAIVSNPPYIPSGDIARLPHEVAHFDPMAALDGGVDGLDGFRDIFAAAAPNLRPGGFVAVEIGQGQAGLVSEIAVNAGFGVIETARDLGERTRIVLACA